MQILLCGYGRMGREVERALTARSHRVVAKVDPTDPIADAKALQKEHLETADVAIEFSQAQAVKDNIARYIESSLPAVVGTTGWRGAEAETLLDQKVVPLLIGSNFSTGAHVLRILTQELAAMLNHAPEYDIMLHELHHKMKTDSPSGTALTLAETIISTLERKTQIASESLQEPIRKNALHVLGLRGGSIPGTHQVTADSDADTIEIIHRARNRSGFALGSVRAAEWLVEKEPGTYHVETYIAEIMKRKASC